MKTRWSDTYNRKYQFIKPWYKLILEMMKRMNRAHSGMALEVGCGVGDFCQKLSEKYKSVVGLDLDRTAIHHAKGLTKNAFFVLGDAQRLPFRDEGFEFVVCTETLEHLPNYKRAFFEIVRVTEKHGYIAITVPNYLSTGVLHDFIWAIWPTTQYKQPHDLHFFNYWNVKRMFRRRNLRIMEIRGMNFIKIPLVENKVKSQQTRLNNFLCFPERYAKEIAFLATNIGVLSYKE